jgi:hypothetical protein
MNSLAGLAGTATHTTLDGRITAIVTCIAVAGSVAGVRLGRGYPRKLCRARSVGS